MVPSPRIEPRDMNDEHPSEDLENPAAHEAPEEDTQPAATHPSLAGGHLLAAISTSIVGILRDHYGRGPMNAKTYVLDDIVVVVMRGSGFTPLEQTIMDSGEPDRVIAMREDFQRVMATRYRHTIEDLTGRKVLAFLSQAHVEPDITMEIFFVDGPLEGFGAVEIIEPA
ncbi:MAG TPA: Na-translocating system protein MpsC family protein [Solirubrobacteraceae bacterium]|nr:Na-translocating system protein MpsC family protein [Solirubrobacteraceae bacterium]